MDYKQREQLKKQLYEKMAQENEEYLTEIKTKPVDEIIESAYQIAWRDNLLLLIGDTADLDIRQIQTLLELPAPLAELYDHWLSQETNEMEVIQNSLECYTTNRINRQMTQLYSDPQTPLYLKSFADAIACEEAYEWRANDERNRECNQEFSAKAGSAHLCQALQPFLEKWVEKYGMERCQFVLSCTIAQRDGDGRFYPPARQIAARFANHREQMGTRISYYANDVHSGIINLAMESLLKMERERDKRKPKDLVKNQPER